MAKDIKFYSLPFFICSCQNDLGEPTLIAARYKEFYDRYKQGDNSIEILKDMNIARMCCRQRFLSIPTIPMINRSKDRFFDYTQRSAITKNTRDLKPKREPPEFPLL
jgi:DNA-directed RNA polymerase subunit N (RpoN/RPB10)